MLRASGLRQHEVTLQARVRELCRLVEHVWGRLALLGLGRGDREVVMPVLRISRALAALSSLFMLAACGGDDDTGGGMQQGSGGAPVGMATGTGGSAAPATSGTG